MDFWLELVFFGQIWAILLEIGPICLDLGHFAQIWAILLGLGLFGRIGPKGDEALRMGQGGMDGRTGGQAGGQTDSPCFLRDFVPFGIAALLPFN